jgi:5-methylcytosine-specific restriction endonuclease McrA
VKVAVWQRDAGRCVECGSQEDLEFDHVIPLAMGGSNTERNLQLLCAACNRRKGATLG